MFIYKSGIFCYVAFLLFSVNFVFSDRIEENEKTITFLAKELRSLHRRVETKISNLQNEIYNQKNLEGNYGHFETRRLYRKFREMKYQLLTLKLDVRQLFYEGLNMKTEMTQAVNKKTQKLSDEIAELRASIKKIHTMLNFAGTFELIREPPSSNNSSTLTITEDETSNDVQADDNLTKDTTSTPATISTGPLQTLDVSLEVNQKLSVPCYLSSTSDNKTTTDNSFPNWNHNGRVIDPKKEKRYRVSYSNDKSVFTLTIKKLKYKDTGILQCKRDPATVLLHVNLKVKEPCNQFLCSGKCIEMARICDKIEDCLYGQDERQCELLADITDGDSIGNGTVVVLLNKMKGWICADGWDQSASQVLCRSVGYSSGKVGQASSLPVTEKGFVVSYINCTGEETSLAKCDFKISQLGSCDTIASAVCSL